MESNCIIFSGHIGNAGYGLDYDPTTQKTILAHRLVFRDTFGYLPKVVMHICDNPACVNPKHLVGGTQKENILDCVSKGRHAAKSKLCREQIEEVLTSKFSSRKLAEKFKVNQKTICNVRNFRYKYL